jgi:hypothetical protein
VSLLFSLRWAARTGSMYVFLPFILIIISHFHLQRFNFVALNLWWTNYALAEKRLDDSRSQTYLPNMQFDSVSHMGWTSLSLVGEKHCLFFLQVLHAFKNFAFGQPSDLCMIVIFVLIQCPFGSSVYWKLAEIPSVARDSR